MVFYRGFILYIFYYIIVVGVVMFMVFVGLVVGIGDVIGNKGWFFIFER